MHLLLSAFAFSPYQGSEAAVGWNFATQLAKHLEVTVLCGDLKAEGKTLQDFKKWQCGGGEIPNLKIVYVPPTAGIRFLERIHRFPLFWPLYYQAYRLWQKRALQAARELHHEHAFDCAHHLTIIGYREPGYLWELGIPWFWGPLSGAPMIPSPFLRQMSAKGKLRWGLRNPANWLQMRISARCRKAAKSAAKIYAVTAEDCEMVQTIWGCRATQMLETGLTPNPSAAVRRRMSPDEPLRLVWSGFIHPRKAILLLIDALHWLQKRLEGPLEQSVEVHILGDGEERSIAESRAENLGLKAALHWHGFLPRADGLAVMSNGHALVHTAIMEGTPHVVLEALALGLPVICHDACGMGTAVTIDSGIKIPLTSPAVSIEGFGNALLRLLQEPDLLVQLSQGALRRALDLTWESKIESIVEDYRNVLCLK